MWIWYNVYMKTIGLFLETSCEYGREFLKGVAKYAQERRDWRLALVDLPGISADKKIFSDCDGIIARVGEARTIERLKATRLPIVDAFCHFKDTGFIMVDLDHAQVAAMAAEYFLRHGFRSFAYCGFKGTGYSDEYFSAFSRILANAACTCIEYPEPEPPSDAAFYSLRPRIPGNTQKLQAWLKALPPQTAIFCATDLRAYEIIKLCAQIGRNVPGDLAVMGVDADTVLCACSQPSITSIDPNAAKIGYAAARLLNAAMENGGKPLKRHDVHRIKPRGIVERESTATYPVKPDWFARALEYVDANMSSPVSSIDLARVAGVSQTALAKAFQRTFGVSTGKYILAAKMREAERMLDEGELLVKQIAARIGFSSVQYFSRTYKQYFGKAPSLGR